MINNSNRAAWAMTALEAFPAADNDLLTNIGDLIVDLLHLARLEAGLDPRELHQWASDRVDCHNSEVEEDGDCDEVPDDTPCLDTSFHDHEMDV